ncbi:MAG: aminodeoxychorismate/anthranilate synthase component II [Gemmatimonadota bacterium]
MILVVDNFDSFVHNLARYIRLEGGETRVVRADVLTREMMRELVPERVVLSPGPGVPGAAGISLETTDLVPPGLPILGVCLGHQCLAQAMGGRVATSLHPTHGRASLIHHGGTGLFTGLPNPFPGGRYHSLSVEPDTLPTHLLAEAWTDHGEIMAFRHVDRPVWGLQFHPESVLTPNGGMILANFLRLPSSGWGARG